MASDVITTVRPSLKFQFLRRQEWKRPKVLLNPDLWKLIGRFTANKVSDLIINQCDILINKLEIKRPPEFLKVIRDLAQAIHDHHKNLLVAMPRQTGKTQALMLLALAHVVVCPQMPICFLSCGRRSRDDLTRLLAASRSRCGVPNDKWTISHRTYGSIWSAAHLPAVPCLYILDESAMCPADDFRTILNANAVSIVGITTPREDLFPGNFTTDGINR